MSASLTAPDRSTTDSASRAMLAALATDDGGAVTRTGVEAALALAGLTRWDPRLGQIGHVIGESAPDAPLSPKQIEAMLGGEGSTLIGRAIRGELVIPDFARFCSVLAEMFDEVKPIADGKVADYIPQLARVNPDAFAMAVCTVDGQQFALGDIDQSYCVQSTCKPINYAIAHDRLGGDRVHHHVGREPSGRSFNELTLNARGLPHNPMINAGAIMCASLIDPKAAAADRFDAIMKTWQSLAGGRAPGFNNAVFLSERDTADRNFALAYFMREKGAFPPETDLQATLNLYFQCCSITVDAPQMAVIAASLANGGVCPTTYEAVFSSEGVKNCLSLMGSCGMYDFSGEYAFSVGLPAKSGVSGSLFITIPGLCGIAIWSPRLDALGNSVRGVAFSKLLAQRFNFHTFAEIGADTGKTNPRRSSMESLVDEAMHLCAASARGDIGELRRLVARGVDINRADYDGRTALHLAASEGTADAVQFLMERGADPSLVDRWGNTPLDDARRGQHEAIERMLARARQPRRTSKAM